MNNILKICPTSKKTLSIHFIAIVSIKEYNKGEELQKVFTIFIIVLLKHITNTLFAA
jgi:hypothetical protein